LKNICPLTCSPQKIFSVHPISTHRYALINPPQNLRFLAPNNTYLNIMAKDVNNLFATVPCGYSLMAGTESIIVHNEICIFDTAPRVIKLHHLLTIDNVYFPISRNQNLYSNFSLNENITFLDHIHVINETVPDVNTTNWLSFIPPEHLPTVQVSVLSFHVIWTLVNSIAIILIYRSRRLGPQITSLPVAPDSVPLTYMHY
jgi:hypothetical protein